MEPEQNQPTLSTPSPHDSKAASKRRWLIIGIAAAVIIVGIILIVAGLNAGKSLPSSTSQQKKPLTIGTKAYLYPCSIATQADYARAFGLSVEKVGTITQTSAPALKNLNEGGDLAKIASDGSDKPRYDSQCSYSLAASDGQRVTTIDVTLLQTDSDEEAKQSFESSRSSAAGDFTRDGVDNGTRQLSTLPSLGAASFVRLPEAGSVLRSIEATFLSGSRVVKLGYNLETAESVDAIMPLLDTYAQAIKTNIQKSGTSQPVDWTGRETFVGKKLVDLCQRVDFKKISAILGGIDFRPDDMTSINTYGALATSHAAEDGAVSNCGLQFNNKANRDAQQTVKRQSSLTARTRWPHEMTVAVNSFASPDAAKAALASKKARAMQPFGGTAPVIRDVQGIGDTAYMYHKENLLGTSFKGQPTESKMIDESLVVVKDGDMITVNFQQASEQTAYDIVPTTISQTQFNDIYRLILDTLAQGRR